MYAAGFYPFPTEEEKWGYWSKHSMVNRILPPALPLYQSLFELIKTKDYFVVTTNVDHQFWKAGFEDGRIFAPQGDYGLIQCGRRCHNNVYDAAGLFCQMDEARKNCRIPFGMVPKCPVCGGPMEMNLLKDENFAEDGHWHDAARNYGKYLESHRGKKLVMLELGVGFNTPAIIRFPFEKYLGENRGWILIRLNLAEAVVPKDFNGRSVGINADLNESLEDILKAVKKLSKGRDD